MYVLLTVTTNDWSFQLKQEDGTDIGSASTFSNTDYRLDRDDSMKAYVIYDAKRIDRAFPPLASYPAERIVIANP